MKEVLDMYHIFDDLVEEEIGEETNNETPEEVEVEEDAWEWCVSTATSYLSTSWKEFFFETEEAARQFYKEKRAAGYAVLIVDRDGY